jgi:MFS family permease
MAWSKTSAAEAGLAPALDAPPVSGAYFALLVLFSMNLLNYVDRYVFYSVGEVMSGELGFNDFWFGVLSSSFMVVYTLVSPVMGYLGDRRSRTRLLAMGVGLWSLATVGTATAGWITGWNHLEMFFWRALLGVGEASYGVIAPTLLADLFHPRLRGRVIGLFYLALPMGGAIGYGLGGWIGYHLGWRNAFLVVGLPGIVAAAAALLIRDPGRGASEGGHTHASSQPSGWSDYLGFFRNRTFLLNTAGLTAVTFATGAYAVWGATFYQRVHGLGVKEAGKWIGGLTLMAGLLGIGLGMWLPDLLRKVTRRAYLFWAGAAVALATPLGMAGLLATDTNTSLSLIFLAMILLASVLGPCNTVTADIVPANRRAAGFALSIFLLHLFGDIASPPLIGWLSILFGREPLASSAVSQGLEAIGHGPIIASDGTITNMTIGMLSLVPMLALGALFFLLGARYLPEDQHEARVHSEGVLAGDDSFPH